MQRSLPASIVLFPCAAVAHGFGGRYDLPLPLGHFIAASGAIVAASFLFMVGKNWGRDSSPRSLRRGARSARIEIPFPPIVRVGAAFVGSAVLMLIIVAGLSGNQSPARNFAPTGVWILGWVGLSFAAAAVDGFWLLVNPWRAAYGWFASRESKAAIVTYRSSWAHWPAVVLFAAFVWLELAWSGRSVPHALGALVMAYVCLTVICCAVFGPVWLARGELFESVFSLFSTVAPLRIRAHGRRLLLVVGTKANASLDLSMSVLVVMLVASVSIDGFFETPAWARIEGGVLGLPDESFVWATLNLSEGAALRLAKTAGLVVMTAAAIGAYFLTCLVATYLGRRTVEKRLNVLDVCRWFAPTLIPIAIGYHVAHYFSFLLDALPSVPSLLANPLGLGDPEPVNRTFFVSPRTQWWAAFFSVVGGHTVAAAMANTVARGKSPNWRGRIAIEAPIAVAMVALTMLSLWILSQPIVESPAG